MIRAAALAAALATAGMATAPIGTSPDAAPATTAPAVTMFVEHLVDSSRPTAATSVTPGSNERLLDTTIAYPTSAKKRMPLIVLSHGDSGDPGKFKILITAWAEAGYVVAAPQFPLTNTFVPGGSQTGDYQNQPADVRFVLDEVLKMSRKSSDSKIAGLVDKRHIGAAGLSLGGGTVYGLVFNTCCRDKRFDAALFMAGVRLPLDRGEDDFRSLPAMLIHGDADSLYRFSEETYPLLTAPKWFVTLHGSTHSAPFEDTPDPADDVVPVIATAFFDRYLKNDKRAAQEILDAIDQYPQAELQREL